MRPASCIFVNVRIEGNLQLNRASRLEADLIEVDANIQAQRAASLVVLNPQVKGDIQFEDGGRRGSSLTSSTCSY